jgi:hypothetical protein
MALSDLDELVLSCRTEQARSYLREAVACYKAGAFRASIVTTWVAVVFDLIEKIKELSLIGDKEAQNVNETYERWQGQVEVGNPDALQKSLEFERTIIDTTYSKFAFFEAQQLIDLHRLRDDRNRCAHPTFQRKDTPYEPPAELARLHLRNAVDYVLSQPPVQGKAAVQTLVALVGSSYFPSEYEKAKIALQKAGLDRPKDSLVTSFVDTLIYGVFDGPVEIKGRRQALVALRACSDLFPALTEPRLARAINKIARQVGDNQFEWVIAVQSHLRQTWNLLEQDNRHKLVEYMRLAKSNRAVVVIPVCLEIAELRPEAEARLKAFSSEEISKVLQKSRDRAVLDRAVQLYCSASQWTEANSIYDLCIAPVLGELTYEDIKTIVEAPNKGADLRGANSFERFLTHVFIQKPIPRSQFIKLLEENGLAPELSRLRAAGDDEIPF